MNFSLKENYKEMKLKESFRGIPLVEHYLKGEPVKAKIKLDIGGEGEYKNLDH